MTARRPADPASTFELVSALLANDDIFELGRRVPQRGEDCGRPRLYPDYAYLLYNALLSVYRSSRRVETELSSPIVWGHLRAAVRERFPTEPHRWLPEAPMRRHHYSYLRDRYLTEPLLDEILGEFRTLACAHALEIGMCAEDARAHSPIPPSTGSCTPTARW